MSGPTQTLLLQSQKMLASTVQFSTYDQTPITRPRRTQPTPRGNWWYEEQTGPDEKKRSPAPSGPNSVPTTPVPRAIPVPHATEVTPYWGPTEAGGRTGQRSTLEHHPTRTLSSPDGHRVPVWARLCTPDSRSAASAP
jgi:hypothetical protein